jgi:hypothetical protein
MRLDRNSQNTNPIRSGERSVGCCVVGWLEVAGHEFRAEAVFDGALIHGHRVAAAHFRALVSATAITEPGERFLHPVKMCMLASAHTFVLCALQSSLISFPGS